MQIISVAGASDIEVIEKPKEIEPPADPAHATIKSNKETIIEINVNSKPLGLFVTGGKMLQPPVVNKKKRRFLQFTDFSGLFST